MKTNYPGKSVLYAYQSLSNDQKNWFSVKFPTDLSIESQVKEVQQSSFPLLKQTEALLLTNLTDEVVVAVGPFTTSEAIPSDVL